MKKTRKVLSIALAILVAFGSMPMLYTSTVAAGTADNPTTAFEESNPYEYDDLFKLNLKHSNNDFFFYQTIDDEYFVVNQSLFLQQYKVSLGSNRTLSFHGINFYEGGSNVVDSVDNAGVVEQPTITTNETTDFLTNYYAAGYETWTSTHENSAGLDCTGAGGSFDLHASGYDLNGKHKQYTWDHRVVFKGNSADVKGQIDTGYYERLTWDWVSDDSAASMDFRIKTTITVVDAREFVKAIAKANDALANPDQYGVGYVSAIEAVMTSIPDDAENLTARYDQATLDKYAEDINAIKEDAADYTEYNYLYNQYSSMTNDSGIYSGQSFTAFKEAIKSIDNGLSKELSGADQQIVNDAVAALRNAYETILINNATLTPDVNHTATIEEMTVTVGTEFNLIQVKDNQAFSLAQPWTIGHNKSQARKFAVTLDTSDTDTNTFISHLDSTSYGTQDFDNKALSQTGATVFTCWDELDANGSFKDSSDFINKDTRTINAGYDGFKKGNTYYLQSTPIFYGKTATQTDTDTAIQYFYTQNFYVGWVNVLGFGGGSGSSAFKTTINITDARGLVKAYEQAGVILSLEESNYTENFLSSLQTAYNAVPKDMVQGIKYYDQATVNATSKTLTDLLNNPETYADYTAYNNKKAEADAIINAGNNGVYEETAFESFVSGVTNVDSALDKNLTSVNQSVVDTATSDIASLIATLEANKYADYTELNNAKDAAQAIVDNPSAYSPETVEEVRKALEEANTVPENMVVGENNVNQDTIDAAADKLNSVVNSATPLDGDYTEYNQAKAEIDAILNAGNVDENGNPIYNEEVFTNVTNYVTSVDTNLDKNLKADNQSTINAATDALVNAKEFLNSYKYADYSAFDDAKAELEEIVANPDKYTDATVDAAQEALDNANTVPGDMYVGENNVNQDTIDAATDAMEQVIANKQEKADYTDFNEALDKLDEILNAPEGTYTDKTIEAAQAAKDAADALDKDLPASEQGTVDSVTDLINGVVDNADKKADYTEFDKVVEDLENIVNNPDKYTEETVKNAQDALDEANGVDKDLSSDDQETLDEITNGLKDVVDNAKEKANYDGLDEALEGAKEIVNAPEGTYTEESVKNAQDAIDAAEALDKDLENNDENQQKINDVIQDLIDAKENAQEKADYTDFNEALDKLDEILNAPEGTYTDKTIEAAQAAKDAADALDKDLPASEQGTVDSVTDLINGVVDNADKKADYTEFDKVVEDLENIVNNPDKYTEETVKNAQDALDEANGVDKDLSSDDQETLDEITNNLKDVVNNAQEKADYTDYNNAKAEADSIVNDDGNGNPIYDEDAFNAYKEAVNNIDTALDKDLPASEQETVDNAVTELESLKATLEAKKYYTVTFKDAEGNVLGTSSYVNGDVFGNLTAPALPEDTDTTAYVGWVYADGTLAKADDVVSGDLDVTVASEDKKLIAKDESGVAIDEITSFVSGIEAGTIVEEVLSKFDNDELVIEIKTFEGVELSSEELVGTGSTITLKSKYTGVIYETRMFIIMGDVDGDGDIDTDDYEISKSVGHGAYEYPENHNYFFVANDIDENGFINAIDAFYIGRLKNS